MPPPIPPLLRRCGNAEVYLELRVERAVCAGTGANLGRRVAKGWVHPSYTLSQATRALLTEQGYLYSHELVATVAGRGLAQDSLVGAMCLELCPT